VYSPTGDCCARDGVADNGVPTGECWLNCRPIGDNKPIIVALTASNENIKKLEFMHIKSITLIKNKQFTLLIILADALLTDDVLPPFGGGDCCAPGLAYDTHMEVSTASRCRMRCSKASFLSV
jgi:hypothetical protein